MAEIQKHFEKFHATIRMDYDLNSELAEKRDIILGKLEASLSDRGRPGFSRLLQGSYKMKTGVKPLPDYEYDIDVGLRFRFSNDAYKASEVRLWVLDAIKKHTQNVEDKGPCIRVSYSEGCHVDLVPYAWEERERLPDLYHLAHRDKGWIPADPPALLKHVTDAVKRYAGTEDATGIDQLRRIIRYLKRWNDRASSPVAGKVSGLAFTLFAINHLSPTKSFDAKSDDRAALEHLARTAEWSGRLQARKPTPEYEDMFGHLSAEDMSSLIARFGALRAALEQARNETDPSAACLILYNVLDTDFPVPDPADTAAKTKAPAILTSSKSA